jgi:hypothetical protein
LNHNTFLFSVSLSLCLSVSLSLSLCVSFLLFWKSKNPIQKSSEWVQQASWMSWTTCHNIGTQNLRLLPTSIMQELTSPCQVSTTRNLLSREPLSPAQMVSRLHLPEQNWWSHNEQNDSFLPGSCRAEHWADLPYGGTVQPSCSLVKPPH